MTREQKIARARELRAADAAYPAIAVEVGVSLQTVKRWLSPNGAEWVRRDNAKRAAAKRKWERENDRRPCPRCGRPMGIGVHRYGVERCADCLAQDHAAQSHATLSRLEALWLEGKTHSEIQVELGWSQGMVGFMVHQARERGYNLPYRRQGAALENIRRGAEKRKAAA